MLIDDTAESPADRERSKQALATDKLILDIRHYESGVLWQRIAGEDLVIGTLYPLPPSTTAIGARIARKLRGSTGAGIMVRADGTRPGDTRSIAA